MKSSRVLGIVLALIAGVLIYAFGIEPHWTALTTQTLQSPNVPMSWDGKKIVFLADIHYGPYYSGERLSRLVEKVNAQQPDLIFLGGDFLDTAEMIQLLQPAVERPATELRDLRERLIVDSAEELGKLRAPLGVYAVLGNHDYWSHPDLIREELSARGIKIVENRGEWVQSGGERIKVGGVEDLWEGSPELAPATADTQTSDLVLLLSHNPDYAEQLTDNQVDYMFSGHLHGGQINFFGWWAPLVPSEYGQKYVRDVVSTPHTTVLSTNGIGMVGLPLRFWSRPEISVYLLSRSDK